MIQSNFDNFIIKNSKTIKKRPDRSVIPGIHHLDLISDIDHKNIPGDGKIEYLLVAYKIESDGHLFKKELIKHVHEIENSQTQTNYIWFFT